MLLLKAIYSADYIHSVRIYLLRHPCSIVKRKWPVRSMTNKNWRSAGCSWNCFDPTRWNMRVLNTGWRKDIQVNCYRRWTVLLDLIVIASEAQFTGIYQIINKTAHCQIKLPADNHRRIRSCVVVFFSFLSCRSWNDISTRLPGYRIDPKNFAISWPDVALSGFWQRCACRQKNRYHQQCKKISFHLYYSSKRIKPLIKHLIKKQLPWYFFS